MEIVRRFVPEGTDPFSMFEYESYDCVLTDFNTGKEKFRQNNCTVPKAWSKNARDILVTKYFRKAGVPNDTLKCDITNNFPAPYWLRPSVPNRAVHGTRGETSVKEVAHRLAGHWTYIGFKDGYFEPSQEQIDDAAARELAASGGHPNRLVAEARLDLAREKNAKAFYDEVVFMLLYQMGAPNSPQWFNTGLWWAYGIAGKGQGHWYVNKTCKTHGEKKAFQAATDLSNSGVTQFGKVSTDQVTDVREANKALSTFLEESDSSYKRVAAHACFILNLEDKMCGDGGILDWYTREGRIFKYGSGSGVNASKLRGKGENLSGGGTSSGVMSWLRVADYGAGAIKSGGTTRRAAKMVVLDVDHPDVLDFIDCKLKSEIAVESLVDGSKTVNHICQWIIDLFCTGGPWTYEEAMESNTMKQVLKEAEELGISDNYVDKALRLALQGVSTWPGVDYTTHFEGPESAYEVVPFQNANHAVRLSKAFYNTVDDNTEWRFVNRKDFSVSGSMLAREIENKIALSAWFSGDPGGHYKDNINDWNVNPNDGEIESSNPCSEYLHLNDTACNLGSIRLTKFLNRSDVFDVDGFKHATRLWTIVLDITNTMAHLPSKEVALGTYNYRTIGLGYCDLGALIMSLGHPYDSEEGCALAGLITAIMHGESLLTSAMLARELGAYPRYWANAEHHQRVVKNHVAALLEEDQFVGLDVEPPKLDWAAAARAINNRDRYLTMQGKVIESFVEAQKISTEHGFRNAQHTLIAPTGTIGILLDCDTTGVEPLYGLIVYKTMIGGTEMKMQPSVAVRAALQSLGFTDEQEKRIFESIRDSDGRYPYPDGRHADVFQTANAADPQMVIPWQAHVKMMAAVQPFLSGAISKTVNMPHDATIEDVKQCYRMGHDLGLKAVALYRDGSKLSQPLNLKKAAKQKEAPKLPEPNVTDYQIGQSETVEGTAATVKAVFDSPPQIRMRHLLPAVRKPGIDVGVEFGEGHLYVRTTRFDDGRVGEIWVTYSADQGMIQALLDNIFKTANVSLQMGVPLASLIKSWRHSRFEPSGRVGGHPNIKWATSAMNLVANLLALHELGDDSGCQVKPVELNTKRDEAVGPPDRVITSLEPSREVTSAFACTTCGSTRFLQTGTCKTCSQCATSTGGCG
jgi:ribonucleoside-diphosphate reductase alpha chain